MNDLRDSAIKRDIEAQLKHDADVNETDIAVNVTDGVATLIGYARDFSDKCAAEEAAKRVRGVIAVANDIELQRASDVSDPEIARAAVAAIQRNVPLHWEKVRPLVHQGSVTLEGRVDDNRTRDLVEAVVRNIKGVVCVVNSLQFEPPSEAVRPEEVKRLIEASLCRNAHLDAAAVVVEVSGAEVTVRGRVHSWFERRQAEEAARAAQGVQRVHNELVVQF
jgi:osmotically-inducible protein OsmY